MFSRTNKPIKPRALKKGDTIRIVAPSSPFEKQPFWNGVTVLENLGFRVTYNESIFSKIPYLAGTDERRAREFIDALEESTSQAVLFARGGYGAMRLLPWLDKYLKNPVSKIVLGFSDVSCLLIYLMQKHHWVTFYGPVVAKEISVHHPQTIGSLTEQLSGYGNTHTYNTPGLITISEGQVTAPLVGGCLSLITSLLGTPYELDTKNKILFLEDTNEKPYEVDRLLTHLKLAGKLTTCKGLVFGTFSGPNPHEHYIETIRDVTRDLSIPIVYGFPSGHTAPKVTLPLGIGVTLNATDKTLTLLEPALA